MSHVHIVLNPEAGQVEPALALIHRALKETGVAWNVRIAKPADHIPTLAQEAVADGADFVAAYGGDGTVSGVAEGLIGTDVPLVVLPGGTANVLSKALGLPYDLHASCGLLGTEYAVVDLDVIELDRGRHALIHVGTGFPARAVGVAGRVEKNGLGPLAYTLGGLKALWNPPHSEFRLVLDGVNVATEGAACMICNTGRIGQGGVSLSPRISMFDGWLDVVVLRDLRPLTLLSLARDLVLGREPTSSSVQTWRSRTIEIEADPPQQVQGDGTVFGETPVRACVVPGGLRVLVPQNAAIRDEARIVG